MLKKILKPLIFPVLPLYYRMEKILTSFAPGTDEYGKCSVCGKYTRFRYHQIIDKDSKITISCGFDERFTKVINYVNSLHCKFCSSKFRVRCAADSLLRNLNGKKYDSIYDLIKNLDEKPGFTILETAGTDGIFSQFYNVPGIIRSEYFDDVPRGTQVDGVRSEDLQALTFEDVSVDVIVALDVFEHIADPDKAFAEVNRVLKPEGIAVITVPIDNRIKRTTSFAGVVNDELMLYREPAYHSDKLREEGALVFTEFGMDVKERIQKLGYNVIFDSYTTERSNISQYVIVIKK